MPFRLTRQAGPPFSVLPSGSTQPRERQASHGTVWTVGGLAPSTPAIDDGHGRLIRSGTNARFYTGRFPPAQDSSQEEFEKHQGRLATALNIDQASRVLGFDHGAPPCAVRQQKRRRFFSSSPEKTTWNGTEWQNHKLSEGTSKRKSLMSALRITDDDLKRGHLASIENSQSCLSAS